MPLLKNTRFLLDEGAYLITAVVQIKKVDDRWQYSMGEQITFDIDDLAKRISEIRSQHNSGNAYIFQTSDPIHDNKILKELPTNSGTNYKFDYILDAEGYLMKFDDGGNRIKEDTSQPRYAHFKNPRNKQKELCVLLPRSIDKKSAPKYMWSIRDEVSKKLDKDTNASCDFYAGLK